MNMNRTTENQLIDEASAEMRRRGVPITPKRVENFVREHAGQQPQGLDGAVAGLNAACEKLDTALSKEIEATLPKGCAALQNGAGKVAVFAMPRTVVDDARNNDELKALVEEARKLQATVDDLTVPVVERMRAGTRLSAVRTLVEGLKAARPGNRLRHLLGR